MLVFHRGTTAGQIISFRSRSSSGTEGAQRVRRARDRMDNVPHSLYDIDPGPDTPEIVRMIVEIPKNSANKYEYDGKLGVFRLDRVLYSAVHYPGDYGFIPGTLAEDSDPLDVLTMVDEP